MKKTLFVRFLLLLLTGLLTQSCSRKCLLNLLPEASADAVWQEYYGPSYGNSPYGGSGSETSPFDVLLNFALWDLNEMVNILTDGPLLGENKQPAYGSLLASNRPGFQPGQYRPFSPTRPKTNTLIQHLALMYGLEIVGKGARQTGGGGTEHTRLLYLEAPVYVIYHHDLPDNKGQIFGGLGPYIGYGLSGTNKSTFNGQTFSTPAFSNNGGFKRFDAGIALTAGYQLPSSLRIRLAYELGLANIESGPSAGFGDKTRNRSLSLNIAYPMVKLVDKFKKR